MVRSNQRRCSVKKVVLKIFTNFTGKRVFSCEICEIFKSMYLEEHLQTTASVSEVSRLTSNEIVNENML